MPDYKIFPQQGSVSIEEAIRVGKKDITYSSRAILLISAIVGVVLPVCGLSLWLLPVLLLAGLLSAFVYTIWMTPKWRIWAYSGVNDIHQFQRCAELELLLPKQSPLLMTGIMSSDQRATLTRLQQRFEEDVPFIDDADIDQVSRIYGSVLSFADHHVPAVIVSSEGIETSQHGFYPWEDIWNEHVGTKLFIRPLWNRGISSGSSADYFCFICPALQVEIPISALNTTSGELDHMLYIHRGRYLQILAGMPPVVPLKKI